MDDLAAAKQALRTGVLARRRALTAKDAAIRSEAICHSIAGIREYIDAQSILFYMPVRNEVDILPLLDDALQQGKHCALPRCANGCSLRLYTIKDLACDVAPGSWGIPEPAEKNECECTGEQFSVIIVPGVAFDLRGVRIGQGAGYYDRLLSGVTGACVIAPAYSFQVLPQVPAGHWDRPVDMIVTEEAVYDCRRAGGSTNG